MKGFFSNLTNQHEDQFLNHLVLSEGHCGYCHKPFLNVFKNEPFLNVFKNGIWHKE